MIVQITGIDNLHEEERNTIMENGCFKKHESSLAVDIDLVGTPVFGDVIVVVMKRPEQEIKMIGTQLHILSNYKYKRSPFKIGFYSDKSEKNIYISEQPFPLESLADIKEGKKMFKVNGFYKIEKSTVNYISEVDE